MRGETTPDSVWRNPIHFIAFGFGSGALPFAPGTWGTVMAIPWYLIIRHFSLPVYLGIVVAAFIFGIWICQVTGKAVGEHDHPGIVWDEITGYFITMIAVPSSWVWVVLGFFLFRLFDIWKPFPIHFLDQHIKGGFGVMLDDVVAAGYALLVLQLVITISR